MTHDRRDIYQEVTDQILERLAKGTVPWRSPIKRGTGDGWPKNFASAKRYRGINVFLLAMSAWERGFGSDYWLTFQQAREKKGSIRKGEKGSLVVFWKQVAKEDRDSGEEIKIPVLRHYTVFNLEQCDGIIIPDAPPIDANAEPFSTLEKAEAIVAGFREPPEIAFGGSKAFYSPSKDKVQIPEPPRFENRERYYETLFHELSHSTGHSKRLNRGLDIDLAPFGSEVYSREELVAEMSGAFLAASCGIGPQTIEQSASYIDNWRKVLQGDKRLVIQAAAAAQKSADWILNVKAIDADSSPESEVLLPEDTIAVPQPFSSPGVLRFEPP
jgi:antirestriction protein ArdC